MAQGTLFSGQVPGEYTRRALSPFWNVYKTKDEKWLCLSVLDMERDWGATCRALELEWMMEDPRFVSGQDRVFKHSDTLIGILEERRSPRRPGRSGGRYWMPRTSCGHRCRTTWKRYRTSRRLRTSTWWR